MILLEHLPLASRVDKTLVGGIDLNKARMRYVVEALIALSPANGLPPPMSPLGSACSANKALYSTALATPPTI